MKNRPTTGEVTDPPVEAPVTGAGKTNARDTTGGAPSRIWTLLARVLVSLVLMAVVIFAAQRIRAYLIATKPVAPQQETAERARQVDVVIADVADVRPTLTVYGQIAAGRTVDLRMLVSGEVIEVSPNLVEGGRVNAGEPLVAIDTFEYEGARVRAKAELAEAELRIVETRARIAQEEAALTRAREQQDIASRELKRLVSLESRGISSTASLDASRSRLSIAQATVEARETQISVLKAQTDREAAALDRLKWAVRKADRDIRNTVLKAPFTGIVSNVAAETGRLLNVSDRITTLIDLDRIEVRVAITHAQYARALGETGTLAGRPVTVIWDGGKNKLEAKGVVDRIAPVTTSSAGGFEVFARLERSEATDAMRPGAFVAVQTPDTLYQGVVRIPQTALHPGKHVFIIGADNRLQDIDVTVVGFDGDAVLVRGDIASGQRIMASRLPDAGPGVLVKPNPSAGKGVSTPPASFTSPTGTVTPSATER